MSNESSFLISIGAAVNEESFKKAIADLKKNIGVAAKALESGDEIGRAHV